VLPLLGAASALRAVVGCFLGLASVAFCREACPFARPSTNLLLVVAQYQILATLLGALVRPQLYRIVFAVVPCHSLLQSRVLNAVHFFTCVPCSADTHPQVVTSDSLGVLGLSPLRLGAALIAANAVTVGLAAGLGLRRWRRNRSRRRLGRGGVGGNAAEVAEALRAVLGTADSAHQPEPRGGGGGGGGGGSGGGGDEKHDVADAAAAALAQCRLDPSSIVMLRKVAGAFGEVFQGTCLGAPCAVKTVLKATDKNLRAFRGEILLTAALRHPNVVGFVGACWGKVRGTSARQVVRRKLLRVTSCSKPTRSQFDTLPPHASSSCLTCSPSQDLICLVLEWVPGGTLQDLLKRDKRVLAAAAQVTAGQGTAAASAARAVGGLPGAAGAEALATGGGGGGVGVATVGVATVGVLEWDDPLLRLASDVARGMAYLHGREFFDEAAGERQRCIIHRDLKPANCLLGAFLSAKVRS